MLGMSPSCATAVCDMEFLSLVFMTPTTMQNYVCLGIFLEKSDSTFIAF